MIKIITLEISGCHECLFCKLESMGFIGNAEFCKSPLFKGKNNVVRTEVRSKTFHKDCPYPNKP